MEWTGLNKANILMDHSYFKPMPMDEDSVKPVNLSRPNGISANEPEESITRCICDFEHDDGYMISCDKCSVWQHVDCVVIDRKCIPDVFLCEVCQPRKLDKHRAIRIQSKKRDVFEGALRGDDDSSATETEDETNNECHRSPESRDSGLYIPVKRSHPSSSPDRISVKRQLVKNQKIEKARKELKTSSHKRNEVDKQIKRKKKTLQSSLKMDEESNNGLHHILEAINHKEHKAIKSPPSIQNFSHENSYTPELQKLLPNIKYNQDNLGNFSPSELNGLRRCPCRVAHLENDREKLILEATSDLVTNCPIIEYVGKVMLRDQFCERWQPHVLFYSKLCGLDLCIDATHFGSDARHIRRSCTPNAEIRHYLQGNSLRFFLHASKSIVSGTEITIGFDFNYHKCGFPVECACTRVSCPVARFQRKECSLKRSHSAKDNNLHQTSNQLNSAYNKRSSNKFSTSEADNLQTPIKMSEHQKTLNLVPSCLNKVKTNNQSETLKHKLVSRYSSSRDSDDEHADDCHRTSPNEEKENSQKKTRDEKKMETILHIFEKMDKSKVKKKGLLNKQKYKKVNRKMHFNEKHEDACLDSVADAAAALASLSGNVDFEAFHKDEIQKNISKRYAMQQTSSTCISPDAFDINASNPAARKHRQLSVSSCSHDRSICSPGSCFSDSAGIKGEQSPSNDTHLDAATTLSLMSSCQMQSPENSNGIKQETETPASMVVSQIWESESLPLHQPEGAFTHTDHENKGCSAKKRWLNRAMTSSQSSDGDFATPPKKRRIARESIASDDNNEIDSSDTIQSPEQKPLTSKLPYQPVCESITDDEDDTHQNNIQGSMYCMPPGMIFSPFQNLATTGLYGLHPSHPLYSISGAMIDPYQYYSSLNLLQNMAMTSTPLLHPYVTQANATSVGGSPSTDQVVSVTSHADEKLSNGTPANECNPMSVQQLPEFVQSSYASPQHFFPKNHQMLENYFPLVRPLVLFPGGPQYPFTVSSNMHSLSPQIPLINGGIPGSLEPIMSQTIHMTADKKITTDNSETDVSSRVEMISPPLPTTLSNMGGPTYRAIDSIMHLDSGSLT